MSASSLNFLGFLIVAILLASVAVLFAVPTTYIVAGALGILLIGLVSSLVKRQPTI